MNARRWVKRSVGFFTGLDWSEWTHSSTHAIDPYMVWADMRGHDGFGRPDARNAEEHRWTLMIERSDRSALAHPRKRPAGELCSATSEAPCEPIFGIIDVNGLYVVRERGADKIHDRHFTAQVRPKDMRHVLCSSLFTRAQLCLPRLLGDTSPIDRFTGPASGTPKVVIGLIDDGFGFAHSSLLDADGRTRVAFLWDQGESRDAAGWKVERNSGYGSEITGALLDRFIEHPPQPASPPWKPYERAGYAPFRLDEHRLTTTGVVDHQRLPFATMQAFTHGHAVAVLAAGRTRALTASSAPSLSAKPLERDPVEDIKLVCVQLPTRTIADTSGGSLGAYVLDGLHYIRHRSASVDDPDGAGTLNPTVVNISYGALAGAHDGTSILECAIRELTSDGNRELWVVLAAGNAHRAQAHAAITLEPGGDPQRLIWRVGPDNPLESYLELWLPDNDSWGKPVARGAVAGIQVNVTSADEVPTPLVNMGDVWTLLDGSGRIACSVIWCRKVVQSERGTLILIAAAPTRRTRQHPVAPHGEWRIDLAYAGEGPISPLTVHAWAERSDLLLGGVPRPQQTAVFADAPIGETSEYHPEAIAARLRPYRNPHASRGGYGVRAVPSLSSLASGSMSNDLFALRIGGGDVIVAGSSRLLDGEASLSSSGGPSSGVSEQAERRLMMQEQTPRTTTLEPDGKRLRPDVSAPGDLSAAVPGLQVDGLFEGVTGRLSGTSAAAALVTRAWARQLHQSAKRTSTLVPLDVGDDVRGRATLTPRADDHFRRGSLRVSTTEFGGPKPAVER